MTDAAQPLPLWIADQVRNDVIGTLFPHRLDSRLRGNDIEGRGNDGVVHPVDTALKPV